MNTDHIIQAVLLQTCKAPSSRLNLNGGDIKTYLEETRVRKRKNTNKGRFFFFDT